MLEYYVYPTVFQSQIKLTLGNADGLGRIRERELVDSLSHFGIDQVEALNHEYFPMIHC